MSERLITEGFVIRNGQFPAFRVGRMLRVKHETVEAYECGTIESEGSRDDTSSHDERGARRRYRLAAQTATDAEREARDLLLDARALVAGITVSHCGAPIRPRRLRLVLDLWISPRSISSASIRVICRRSMLSEAAISVTEAQKAQIRSLAKSPSVVSPMAWQPTALLLSPSGRRAVSTKRNSCQRVRSAGKPACVRCCIMADPQHSIRIIFYGR